MQITSNSVSFLFARTGYLVVRIENEGAAEKSRMRRREPPEKLRHLITHLHLRHTPTQNSHTYTYLARIRTECREHYEK